MQNLVEHWSGQTAIVTRPEDKAVRGSSFYKLSYPQTINGGIGRDIIFDYVHRVATVEKDENGYLVAGYLVKTDKDIDLILGDYAIMTKALLHGKRFNKFIDAQLAFDAAYKAAIGYRKPPAYLIGGSPLEFDTVNEDTMSISDYGRVIAWIEINGENSADICNISFECYSSAYEPVRDKTDGVTYLTVKDAINAFSSAYSDTFPIGA